MIEPSTETDNRREFDQHLLGAIGICVALILATPLIISASPLITLINTRFPFTVGRAIFARSIIEIIFTLWLILIVCYPQHRPSRSWVIISLSIGLSVSIITGLTGINFTRSLWSTFERMNGVFDQAHWLAFILVIGTVYRSLPDWKILFTLNLGVAGFISLIGIIQYYNWIVDPFLLERLTFNDSTNYSESNWGSASFLAAYATINSVLGLGLILQSIHSGQKNPAPPNDNPKMLDQTESKLKGLHFFQIFWLLTTFLCLWALWLTASRGPFLSLGLGIVILSVGYSFWQTGRIKTVIVYVFLFLSLVLITLSIVVRVVDDDLESSMPMIWRMLGPEEDSSNDRRITALKAAIGAYKEKPVFGWGPENYLVPWGKHSVIVTSDKVKPFDAGHSSLTERLVTQGTLGLLSSILICSTIIIVLVRSIRRRPVHHRPFVIVITAALIASFAQKMFILDTISVTLQLSLLIAFVVSAEGQLRIDTESNAQDDSNKPHHTKQKRAWLIVPIVASSIWSLYSYNYKPYLAARASYESLSASLLTDISANFNRSVDEFPALANIPRRLMIEHVGCGLVTMTNADYVEAVNLVTQVGQEALQIEPQNWRIHASLAQTYQRASLRNPDHLELNIDYLELARAHVQEAFRLAPHTSQTNSVKVQQERLERSPSVDFRRELIESCT